MSESPLVSLSRLKVLVVEDSAPLQAVLTNVLLDVSGLELAGMVGTAADALAANELRHPDIVILDLVLRAGNGLDVLHAIKQRRPACRVWIFTAHDSEGVRARCLAAGADRFFSKNVQHQELIQQLQQLARWRAKKLHANRPAPELAGRHRPLSA